jgi:hypothetical protein
LIDEYITKLEESVEKYADTFFTTLTKSNESLLLKFDEILTMDEVNKHGILLVIHFFFAKKVALKRKCCLIFCF